MSRGSRQNPFTYLSRNIWNWLTLGVFFFKFCSHQRHRVVIVKSRECVSANVCVLHNEKQCSPSLSCSPSIAVALPVALALSRTLLPFATRGGCCICVCESDATDDGTVTATGQQRKNVFDNAKKKNENSLRSSVRATSSTNFTTNKPRHYWEQDVCAFSARYGRRFAFRVSQIRSWSGRSSVKEKIECSIRKSRKKTQVLSEGRTIQVCSLTAFILISICRIFAWNKVFVAESEKSSVELVFIGQWKIPHCWAAVDSRNFSGGKVLVWKQEPPKECEIAELIN